MKVAALGLAALAGLTYASPTPEPLAPIDVAHTSLEFDIKRSALDNGNVAFSILRTDDLVDAETHTLLAERLSHVAVRIQLDQANAGIRVNDQLVTLGESQDSQPIAVSIVKSDALLLPVKIPSTVLATAEEMNQAVASMSPGIVSLEVRLESEVVEAGLALGSTSEGEMRAMVVDGLRLRRVGVFIKINEIEGVDIEHSSLIYAPILQLLVSSNTEDGTITQVKTLSINGEAPVDNAPAMPGIAMINDMLPEIARKPQDNVDAHWRPHHHRPGFFGWLATVFGLAPSPPHRRHPCPAKFRKGLAAGQTQEMQVAEDNSDVHSEQPLEHHGYGHPRGHHMRHRNACFVRRFVSGIAFVVNSIWSSILGQIAIGLLAGGALFSLIRRARRCSRYTPLETDLTRDVEVEKKVMDETVFVDELPRYEPVAIVVEEVPSKE